MFFKILSNGVSCGMLIFVLGVFFCLVCLVSVSEVVVVLLLLYLFVLIVKVVFCFVIIFLKSVVFVMFLI